MSDLDADLYGDLYGNDEQEFAVPTERGQERVPPQPTETRTPQEPQLAQAHAEKQPEDSSHTVPTANQVNPSASTMVSNGSAIPSYTSESAQPIQTYQERQADDYGEASKSHQDFQTAGSVDRPVRPSEMKEEG
ncbi:hypothetical protein C8Q72DRAFT_769688 [Fomitopsis betulina]|nr:hypothetical protein C8Q72DRAFT_769688 [Fomitopsis betulina]